ncbi:MAG: hypothetical protein WCA27_14890 [Candidatus Sulfotelmatobacter sp.]
MDTNTCAEFHGHDVMQITNWLFIFSDTGLIEEYDASNEVIE